MPPKGTVFNKVRVAVVDDEQDMQSLIKDLLERTSDFSCAACFSNAADALAGLPSLRPDVVLMDIRMPGINGIECAERLKRKMRGLKIIMMTGVHDADAVENSSKAGADDYLTKPVTADQLVATLRFVVNGRGRDNSPARRQGPGLGDSSTEAEAMNSRLIEVSNWEELAQAANYSTALLAQRCQVSTRQLERFSLQKFGESPHHWLCRFRMKRALELLRSNHSVKDAALTLGYRSVAHFSREFKRWHGFPPSHHRLREVQPPPR